MGDRLGELPDEQARCAAPTLETLVRAVRPGQGGALRGALLELADQNPQKEVLGATPAQEFGVEAEFAPSRIRCVERPVGTGEAVEGMARRSTTGLPATVGPRIEAGPRGSGRGFTYETELGALARALHQPVEDTAHATLARGGPHGWPVTDCRVTLVRSGFDSPLAEPRSVGRQAAGRHGSSPANRRHAGSGRGSCHCRGSRAARGCGGRRCRATVRSGRPGRHRRRDHRIRWN